MSNLHSGSQIDRTFQPCRPSSAVDIHNPPPPPFPIQFIHTYISVYVALSLCSLQAPLLHAPELARRRPDSSGPEVLRGCGVGGQRAGGLCGHVQGVPPRDSLSLGALPRHTGPAQLCHTHLLPGAHLHLQDTACQEVEVRMYIYIRRYYRGCVNTLHTHHCN